MHRKTVSPFFLIALLTVSFALAAVKAPTIVDYTGFESGWDGWEAVGGTGTYQRGTSFKRSGSFSVYTPTGKIDNRGPSPPYSEDFYHIRKIFVWRGVVLLSAWYRGVGKTSDAGMSYTLWFANGTFIHGAWLANVNGELWVEGCGNLTDEVEQEGFDMDAMQGQTVLLALFTEWYDYATETLYTGFGAIDDVNLTFIVEEQEQQQEQQIPRPQAAFKLSSLNLGSVVQGEQKTFKVSFAFSGETLTLQDVRFAGDGSSWLSTETLLPRSYSKLSEPCFQAVLNLPKNASLGEYSVQVYAAAVVDGYTVSDTAAVSFEVAPSGSVGVLGGWMQKAKEVLVRLLGNPFILLLLLLLVAIFSRYSLRKRRR